MQQHVENPGRITPERLSAGILSCVVPGQQTQSNGARLSVTTSRMDGSQGFDMGNGGNRRP